MEIDEQVSAAKFEVILPHPDERQRWRPSAAEAGPPGYDGISPATRAAGVPDLDRKAGCIRDVAHA